jgi:putative sigma-54 modulation protein
MKISKSSNSKQNELNVKFTFLHIDASEALQSHALNELEKIARHFGYSGKDSSWHVQISKSRHNCNVQIDVHSGWGHFQSLAKEKDFYLSFDEAAFKLEKQVQKQREKHQNHSKPEHSKRGKLARLNNQLEYNDASLFELPVSTTRKPA